MAKMDGGKFHDIVPSSQMMAHSFALYGLRVTFSYLHKRQIFNKVYGKEEIWR